MDLIIYIILGILGAVFGSFLACMGYRIPNKIKTTYPSSFCPNCNKSLKWYMNVPILSYILLKGKCYYCKKSIGFIYFFCEILCSFLFILSYMIFGLSNDFVIAIILSCAFIVTIVSDFKYYYISDRVLVISGILLIINMFSYMNYSDILFRILTGIIVLLIMIGIKVLGNSMFNKESLGDGDIKLMSIIGLALGLINSFLSLFASSVIALIFILINYKTRRNSIIPFGPFLLIGALIILFLGSIINPYIIEYLAL